MAGFDLSCLDTHTASQAGTPMTLVNYRTLAPMVRPDGSLVTITMLGRASDVYRDTQRALQETRADRASRGIRPSVDETVAEDVQLLTACTVAWTIDQLDGKDFPCTPDNVRLMWNDQRFTALRDRAIRYIIDDGTFLPASPPAS
jgi:hypothetical protein